MPLPPAPFDDEPAAEDPADDVPLDDVPLDEVPLEEVPLEEVPPEEVPLDDVALDEVPLDEESPPAALFEPVAPAPSLLELPHPVSAASAMSCAAQATRDRVPIVSPYRTTCSARNGAIRPHCAPFPGLRAIRSNVERSAQRRDGMRSGRHPPNLLRCRNVPLLIVLSLRAALESRLAASGGLDSCKMSRMRRLVLWLTLFFCLATLGGACSSDKQLAGLAAGCSINSDCASPLVCAFRRCHVACTSSRDCGAGQRCVSSDRPTHVCQLDDERNCTFTSDCPSGEYCGVDQQCRDECIADIDCLKDQVCISRTCADKTELTDAGTLVSKSDAGPPVSSGQPCLYTSDCPAPLVCRELTCTLECRTTADCKTGDCIDGRCVASPNVLIGPMGGKVVGLGGKVELNIPPGSLSKAELITITSLDAWPAGAIGQAFEIDPSGLQFTAGATLVYHYGEEIGSTALADLRLATAIGTTWTSLDTKLDPTAQTLSAQLAHLSVYGVVGKPAPKDAGSDVSTMPMGCDSMACSGSKLDGCCPGACSATTDVDCAGCGNGRLDPGETCDPVADCPKACPEMQCQLFTLQNGGTCQAKCVAAGTQTKCINADGCCPAGCNTTNDSDCKPVCGNGVVEQGELCDGNCPSKCPPVGCQQMTMQGAAATCDAHCVNGAVTTACVANDSCCPAACNATSDADCVPRCGNGIVEGTEICDGNCPTSCPALGCQLRVLQGSAQTCDVTCINGGQQTACINNDSCCPAGCNSLNDNDCKPACGNGVVESGETCDPVSNCTALQTACINDANNVVTASGSAGACTFVCNRSQRTCGPADTYCPTNVACGPTTDADCPGCGNGRVESGLGETCDPPSACTTQQTACVSDANNVRTSSGSTANCTYKCTTVARACGPADGFCPTGCGPTMDVDCPGCGNGRIEGGETCDVGPATPTCASINCNDGNACTTDTRNGSDAACNVTCSHTNITTCSMTGDGCCPGGCNATNDADCGAVCGNGVREGAETCEVAPATPLCTSINCNDGNACTTDVRNGSNASCNVTCSNVTVTSCVNGDGCCPGGGFGACNATNDNDCAAVCGNGVIEGLETCDVAPASPTCASITCDDGNACTVDTRSGTDSSCNVLCAHAAIISCSQTGKDGCCPSGCNANTDSDCAAVCGNGVLEPGEKCETGIAGSCPTACPANGCILPDLVNGGTCTAACVDQGRRQTQCIDGDGCCPSGCTDFSDKDCPTQNDTCASAIDISGGGDFPFSLLTAKSDLAQPLCGTPGPEVFFSFTITNVTGVYLDVFDPAGNKVDVSLEVYTGSCPPLGALTGVACDNNTGQKQCGTPNPWPLIFNASLNKGTYYVAARAQNGNLGRYTLRFQRVPAPCLGAAMPSTAVATTCTQQDLYSPTCGGQAGGQDNTYYVVKCMNPGLAVDTCSGRTVIDTILQVNTGSIDLTNGRCVLTPTDPTARPVACNDDTVAKCAANGSGRTSAIPDSGRGMRGLFTITVDSATAASCGGYGFNGVVNP
jgi:hypothetical protein